MKTSDHLEMKIAKLLRIGVSLAGLILLAGVILQFKVSGDPFFNFQTYDEIPLVDLLKIHFKTKQWGALVSYLGLVILISLPLIRLLLTTFLFFRRKEFVMGLLALCVSLTLLVSMLLGIKH